jgi:hypothetical protein
MKRRVKPISIIILIVMTALYAVPFTNSDDCEMPSCGIEMMACEMEMDSPCCSMMKDNNSISFIPLASAPLIKVDVQKQLTCTIQLSNNLILPELNDCSEGYFHYKLPQGEAHQGFLPPLLA